MRQQDIAARASGPGIVLRRLSQIQFSAGDVILGVLLHPGVIQASVVGDKIEHQTQATLPQPLAQAGQGRIATQRLMHRVASDGETGPGDVFLAQVRQRRLEFLAPFVVAT